MKDKFLFKIALDVVMAVLFIALLEVYVTGLPFHEIGGLAAGALFVLHIALNRRWIKNVSKNFFKPGIKAKVRLVYLLNATFLLGVCVIIGTGVQISHVLFWSGPVGHNSTLVAVHKWVSYSCLGIFAVHVYIHKDYIQKALRRITAFSRHGVSGEVFRWAGRATVVAATAYLLAGSVMRDNTAAIAANSTAAGHSEKYVVTETNSGGASGSFTDADSNNGSLADFLSGMFCSGCRNHCPLTSLKCDKGKAYLEEAIEQYEKTE